MPFDGREYSGRMPLVGPLAAHSSANGTGEVLAGAQRASYMRMRWGARMIGQQTYPMFQRYLRSNGVEPVVASSGTWVDVARFEDVQIPAWCTHVTAQLSARVRSTAPSSVFAKVVVTDGTNTDDGLVTQVDFEPLSVVPNRAVFSLWAPGDSATCALLCSVAVVNARVTPGPHGARTVTVRAFALGSDSGPQYLQPGLVTCWWESRG